jgi:hypothetical protein
LGRRVEESFSFEESVEWMTIDGLLTAALKRIGDYDQRHRKVNDDDGKGRLAITLISLDDSAI